MDPFAALADPVRRALLRSLADGPARVVDLAASHPISRPAVSRHLRLLTEAGLTSVAEHGRERHYALDRSGLDPVAGYLADLRPRAPFDERSFDGLDLEVRRTVRDRRTDTTDPSQEETA
jgi:DNA-binding transcriptional ArsR family regulator